jgi:hypothetical protein
LKILNYQRRSGTCKGNKRQEKEEDKKTASSTDKTKERHS